MTCALRSECCRALGRKDSLGSAFDAMREQETQARREELLDIWATDVLGLLDFDSRTFGIANKPTVISLRRSVVSNTANLIAFVRFYAGDLWISRTPHVTVTQMNRNSRRKVIICSHLKLQVAIIRLLPIR